MQTAAMVAEKRDKQGLAASAVRAILSLLYSIHERVCDHRAT
jgi:hypothetical protein